MEELFASFRCIAGTCAGLSGGHGELIEDRSCSHAKQALARLRSVTQRESGGRSCEHETHAIGPIERLDEAQQEPVGGL